MDVEEQDVAVAGFQRAQGFGGRGGIAVRGFAVGDVDDDGREAVGVLGDQRARTSRAWVSAWPMAWRHGPPDRTRPGNGWAADMPPAPSSSSSCVPRPAPAGCRCQRWVRVRDRPTAAQGRAHFIAVADDADVEVVAIPFLFGAFDHQVLQQAVDRIGDQILLCVVLAGGRADRPLSRIGG